MDKYDKEKLNEYAKELFALCLEKEIEFNFYYDKMEFYLFIDESCWWTHLDKDKFQCKDDFEIPIWELIEKVKQL